MPAVFVYGTLRSGQQNHWLMRELAATRVGDALTVAPMSLWLDRETGIPYLTVEPRWRIVGELYSVPGGALPQLDAFEEHPDVYRREPLRVVQEARERRAYAYVYPGSVVGMQLIDGGDFVLAVARATGAR